MPIKDFHTLDLIEKLTVTYNTIMQARFLRNAYDTMEFDYAVRNTIDGFTRENAYYRTNGYTYSELYSAILGLAEFVYKIRTEVLPNVKFFLIAATKNEPDKLREEMAADNLKANIDVLSDQINILYVHAVKMDKETHNVKSPVYTRTPELSKLGQLLTESSKGIVR